jgi:hypothetical protein
MQQKWIFVIKKLTNNIIFAKFLIYYCISYEKEKAVLYGRTAFFKKKMLDQ